MRPLRKVLVALAVAAAPLAPMAFAPALAAHLEIGAGYSWGRRDANGFWVQNQNPHVMKLNSPTWYAGVGGHSWRYLAWHVDFVHLGTYGENSWDTSDQAAAAGLTCANATCYNFVGSGVSNGVRFTAGPTFGVDHWHLTLQGGLFLYDSTWHVVVYNTAGQPVAHLDHWNRVQVGDVVGASLRYRAFSLNVDRYVMRAPQDYYQPLIYGATTVTAGWEF